MANYAEITAKIEDAVTAAATVAQGLGYPNNREIAPISPTGWQASVVSATGKAESSEHEVAEVLPEAQKN